MKVAEWNREDYEVIGVDACKWIIINKKTKEPLFVDQRWAWKQSAEDVLDAFDRMIKENFNAPY
jgi:hypothetical protein